MIPHNEATIRFSGKEMASTKKLSDYLGKNEKSKVIVKIQKVIFKLKSLLTYDDKERNKLKIILFNKKYLNLNRKEKERQEESLS